MDIDEFMRIDKPIERRVVKGMNLNAYRKSESESEPALKREKIGNSFAQDLKNEQDRALEKRFRVKREPQRASTMDDIDDDGASTSAGSKIGGQKEIYRRYKFNNDPFNANLPIFRFKKVIQRRIRETPVVIIKGETGCGKSTQVPQFILDDCYSRNEYCNVIVTQPRRLAAVSLAEQVSRERKCELGTLVGHHIGLDRRTSDDTRLVYCTTGVLLQKLVKTKHMGMYTHIILDEIHERDEEMEFLLIMIKRFMIFDPFSTKIILMSATIDTEEFAEYFKLPLPGNAGRWMQAPSIDLEQERQFSVKQYYLEDVAALQRGVKVDYENPGIDESMYQLAVKVIETLSTGDSSRNGGCILVFLPGIHEITNLQKLLSAEKERLKRSNRRIMDWNIIPLHSTVPSETQRSVFLRSANNTMKVILATNIAESSITVPDVKYVIDFCLARLLEVDPDTGFARLRLKWAARSSCKQRAGRTGRTSDGECFRLVSRDFFQGEMRENEVPAMLRCSLEAIVLKAKMLDENEAPAKIIGLAINPPDLSDIQYAVLNLKEARGLHFGVGSRKYVKDDGDMTFVGKIMDALPIDFRASKLIVLGYIFNVLEECIIIAAGITVQKVFSMNFNDTMKTYSKKLLFADGSGSDLIAILNAYQYYVRKIYDNHYHLDESRTQALERASLDPRGLHEMYNLVNEIKTRLEPFNLTPSEGVNRIHLSPRDKNTILKVCISGAFYPNYFLRASSITREDIERDMAHELNGRDPCNTILYRGIGYEDMGILYQNQVKAYLRDRGVIASPDDVKITFDKGTQKMFVTFLGKQQLIDAGANENKPISDWVPGRVCTQVYKAIKLAREKDFLKLRVMDKDNMIRYAESIGAGNYEYGVFNPKNVNIKHEDLCCLPDKFTKSIIGRVSSIETPNKFWIKPTDSKNEFIVTAIRRALNNQPLERVTELTDLKGKLVAVHVRNEEARAKNYGRMFHRARIISTVLINGMHKYQVLLIDEGEEALVESDRICRLEALWVRGKQLGLRDDNKIYVADIPPRVYEASLAEIRPSYVTSAAGKWTPDAVDKFKQLMSQQDEFEIEVYSTWNGVANVIVYDKYKNSINKVLVREQLAQTCEESYPSKQDHAVRFHAQHFVHRENDESPVTLEILDYLRDFYATNYKPPPEYLCTKVIQLRGPTSPLETQVYATFRSGQSKSMTVDRLSVNSILLDTDPQDSTDRLVVAANVASNAHRGDLTLRSTTIMPNISGFSQFMTLLFAPRIEIHRDVTETRYYSLLGGLGFKETRDEETISLFPEHDVAMKFDCFVDQDDMLQLNKLRYTMSALLHTNPGEKVPDLKPQDVVELQKEAFSILIKFLRKERKFIDQRMQEVADFKWGAVDEDELQFVEGAQVYGDRAVFPSFTFMLLQNETQEEIERYRENNEQLHQIAFSSGTMSDQIECLLCSKTLQTRPQVQTHLFTKLHKDRAEQCHARFVVQNYQAKN
ncbi:LOW QUALITY PROTEIN: probable ATP-dependent RNA helicase spindle-E [Culicoides brevitarsis]|uniref:LOW QUALITY PROTEIN: probable ATP-dependent RNA helicase spindle-E n=1 Tax=Culicoides brevitarsis TaxID=469753 RepID=UPI00307B5A25